MSSWLDKLSAKIRIRKSLLIYVAFPGIVAILLFVGLIQQGIIGSFRTATLSVYVISESDKKPIANATVVAGSLTGTTDEDGKATATGELSGLKESTQVSISKTGYITFTQALVIKRGDNDLGTVELKESPAAKVDLTIRVTNYISEEVVKDATVSIADIIGIYSSAQNEYLITGVPVGKYELKVSSNNFNEYSTNIEVAKDSKKLDSVQLVPSGLIVFESNRDRGKRGIFTAKYDGSDQKPLVERVGNLQDYRPSLGPNQRKVFFTSTRDGEKRKGTNEYKEYMYLVDVDGSNLTKITEVSSDYATWSPDGGFIGLTKYNSDYSKSTLYTYDLLAKKLRSFSDYNSSSFVFSKSGGKIAFVSYDNNDGSEKLYFGNSIGTGVKLVKSVLEEYDYISGLEFIGDEKIRYTLYDNSTEETNWYEYTISTAATKKITAPEIDEDYAVQSPDGKYRAYVSTRDGKTNLFISTIDGKDEKQLTTLSTVTAGNLLWSLDNSFIMFNSHTIGETARYLVSVNGKAKPKKIVDINLDWYY